MVTQSQQDALSTDELVTSQALVPHSFSMLRADTSTDLELVVESCLRLLLEAPWPSSQGARPQVAGSAHKQSGYWNLGVRVSDRSSLTAVTRSLRSVVQELNLLLRQHGRRAHGTLSVLAETVFPRRTKIWRMLRALGIFCLVWVHFKRAKCGLRIRLGKYQCLFPSWGSRCSVA